ncbi:hypothetical protein LTR15_000834 [Elasticomyces elasticus]|nr:hypothetical protein LTR15_000834 [Elasticomyces elasticus]
MARRWKKLPAVPRDATTRHGSTRRLLLLTTTSLASIIVFLLVLAQLRAWPWRRVHGLTVHEEVSSSLWDAIRLHPEDHAYRLPTVIEHNWTISTGFRRPDGVLKQVYLVNDAFPGPTLGLRSGDQLIVNVYNALPNDEGVSIHWHGLLMRGANDQDGAVGITQDAIPAGQMLTYEFTVSNEQSGTFWYHAHSAVQRADGLFGGLIVHEPADFARKASTEPTNEYLLLLQDYYHRSAVEALDFYMHLGSFGNEPVPDAILVNGLGTFDCSNIVPARPVDCEARPSGVPALRLDRSKKTIFRVINVGAYAGVSLSMVGSVMQVLALDGGNRVIAKATHSAGVLYPGERVDLLIEPLSEAASGEAYLQLELDTTNFKYPNPTLNPLQRVPVRWHGMAHPGIAVGLPHTHVNIQELKALHDVSNLMPAKADMTFVLYAMTQKLAHLKNVPHGFINNTYWEPQSPPLISLDRTQYDKQQFVINIPFIPDAPLWVDIVLNNLDEEGHPFHLHGHDLWVLATHSSSYNWGSFNPFGDAEPPGGPYNLVDPVKKDTVLIPRRGYAVLRLRADNPGIWLLHCHVLWHMASGMAMAFEVS